ncbi:hypothetical protein ECDEC10F_3345 [Escherichia coli DEC10F]|nr:hypothetical protein ECDEC10F_3345 [Escherichia coli DEC10F]
MSFSCSACITAHFIQPLNILPRPVTKPDLQMPKQPLNLCGIFGVKKGQSGDECAICIREPAIAVCLNNVSRPQTEPYLCLPRVALRSLRSGCPYRASRTCFSFRSLWALPGLPHRYLPLDPVDLHFPSDRSLPALPCHLSAPAGLPDQHHLPVPVRRLPPTGPVSPRSPLSPFGP